MAYTRQTLSTAKDTNLKTAIGIPGWAQALIDQGLDARDAQLAFAKTPQLYRAVNLRAHAMSGVPYCIYRGGPTSTTETEFPFPQTLTKLIYELEASLLVSGAGYLLKLQPSVGGKRVVGLQYLSPSTMQVVYTDNKLTFIQNVRGQRYGPWEADRLVYMREFSFTDDVGPGLAPAKVALPAANLRIALSDFATGFFASGGQPLTLLTLAGNPPPTEVERTEAFFKRTMAGVKNAWRVLAVRSEVTVTPITPEIRTMAMPELADASTREIAAAFGIPLSLLTSDSANYATAQSDMRMFYENTVKPRLLMYETAFNEQLLHPMGLRLQFHPEEMQIFQTDEAERSGSLKNLVDAGIDLKTAMTILGYHVTDIESVQESPDAEAGEGPDQPTYGAGMANGTTPPLLDETAIGKALAKDRDNAISLQLYAAQAQKKSIDTEARTWERLSVKDRQRATEFSCIHVSPEQEEWLKYQLATTVAPADYLFSAATKNTLGLRTKAEKAVAKQVKKAFEAYATRIREAAAAGIVDEKAVTEMLEQLGGNVSPLLADVFNKNLIVAATTFGNPVDREKYQTAAQTWAATHEIILTDELENTTLNDLQRAVVELVQDPREDVGNLDEALRLRLYKTLGPARTKMIAITEVARAKAAAINEFYFDLVEDDEDGQETAVRRWATQLDEKVCAICGPYDDTLQDVWGATYPDGPPAHPNCRCEIGVERTAVPLRPPPQPGVKPKRPRKPRVKPEPVVAGANLVPIPTGVLPGEMNGAQLRSLLLQTFTTSKQQELIAKSAEYMPALLALKKFQRTQKRRDRVKPNETGMEYQARIDIDRNKILDLKTKEHDLRVWIELNAPSINPEVHALLRVPDPIKWTIVQGDANFPIRAEMLEGAAFSESIVSKKIIAKVLGPTEFFVTYKKASGMRSNARDTEVFMAFNHDAETAVHELGHILDAQTSTVTNNSNYNLPTAAELANGQTITIDTGQASYYHMVNRSKPPSKNQDLGTLFFEPRMRGEKRRVQIGTEFYHPYASRDYTFWYGFGASEVLTMGMEALFNNPLHLAANDPELFDFTIDVIRGTN